MSRTEDGPQKVWHLIWSQLCIDHDPLVGVAERGLGRNTRTSGKAMQWFSYFQCEAANSFCRNIRIQRFCYLLLMWQSWPWQRVFLRECATIAMFADPIPIGGGIDCLATRHSWKDDCHTPLKVSNGSPSPVHLGQQAWLELNGPGFAKNEKTVIGMSNMLTILILQINS